MTDNQAALPPLDEPGDAELISAVRAGDVSAYGKLFERHVEAARRLARQLVSSGDVDDLVSEAFAKVLTVLQKGGGPDLAFRAYLLTSLRRLHVDKLRAGARLQTTDDLTPYDPGVPFEDTAVAGFENAAAARAFSSLPERWQQVLWHTEVEGQKPADIAPLLGMSPNSVSALAYRAREGLRQAFVSMHAQDAVDDACAETRANLGAYIRNGISRRDTAKVEAHLQSCRECTAIYLELTEVNANLGAILAPMALGAAGAGYLSASHAAAVAGAKGGLILLLGRAKDWAVSNPVAAIGAGVAAAAVVAAGIAIGVTGHNHAAPVATPPAVSPSSTPSPALPSLTPPATAPSSHSSPPASTHPGTTPVTTPPAPPAPPVAPPPTRPAPVQPVDTSPVINQPLQPQSASPGSSVTIDLIRGATSPAGYPLHVVSAKAGHGTVTQHASGASAGAVRSGPHGGAAGAAGAHGAGAASTGAGTVTYTPAAGWRGVDTITYVLGDGHGGTVAGSVRVTTPNAGPVAVDRSISTSWAGPSCQGQSLLVCAFTTTGSVDLLTGITDPNHDRVSVVGLGPDRAQTLQTTYGTVTLADDGTATYVANLTSFLTAGVLTDHFSYTITDHPPHGYAARRSTATVTVQVNPLGARAPETVADTAAITHPSVSAPTSTRPIAVLANDVNLDGPHSALRITGVTQPQDGTAVVNRGTTITYTADADVGGRPGRPAHDTFDYTVADGRGRHASAAVTVTLGEPAGSVRLWNQPVTVQGYAHVHLFARVPTNGTATVHLVIHGITGWAPGGTHEGCNAPAAPQDDVLDVTCTVNAGSEVDVLHYDFDYATDPSTGLPAWDLTATITPNGFLDTTPDNDTYRADGADPEGV